jgi:hypothetical protein
VNAVDLPNDGEHVRNVTGHCDPKALWRAVEELAAAIEPSPNPSLQGRGIFGPSLQGRGNVGVVLHYSGYGYDRNGAPAWLAGALRQSSSGQAAHVVSYFHELYATGRPWQRAFWYSARQRRVASEIARLSDAVITNREQSARWLEEQTERPGGSVASLSVPSNVGEPDELPTIDSRPPRALTFGGDFSKRFALRDEALVVAQLLRRYEISELVDIGSVSPIDQAAFERFGIAVKVMGYLPSEEVSRQLLQCRIGFLDYPLDCVAKSSIFGAFAAHGVIPVLRNDDEPADGVMLGRQALALSSALASSPTPELQGISGEIRAWYCSSVLHAQALLTCLHQTV